MLKSMTGFGLAQVEYKATRILAEIKSLNSKFFELSIRLPRAHIHQEMTLRTEAQKYLERGKVSIAITIEQLEPSQIKAARIDHFLLKKYYSELFLTSLELGAANESLLQACLSLPNVISQDDDQSDPDEWDQIYKAFRKALEATTGFRTDEGKVLHTDIANRIELISNHLKIINETEGTRIPMIKEKIQNHLAQAVGAGNIDQNRLEQEMIYFVERLDITEEKIRLQSHCDYFLENLKSAEGTGKKLGFISQEIGREINTIGSKVNDAQIQQRIVLMKDELEKIKEQLLNIL